MSSVIAAPKKTKRNKEEREEARFDLRFMFASLFANIIEERRAEGQTLSKLAEDIGVDKGQLANWLATEPNWQLSSVADIASGLKLKLRLHAIDQRGTCWSPSGITAPEVKKQLTQTASTFVTMHVVRQASEQAPPKGVHFTRSASAHPSVQGNQQTTTRTITMPTKAYEVLP